MCVYFIFVVVIGDFGALFMLAVKLSNLQTGNLASVTSPNHDDRGLCQPRFGQPRIRGSVSLVCHSLHLPLLRLSQTQVLETCFLTFAY